MRTFTGALAADQATYLRLLGQRTGAVFSRSAMMQGFERIRAMQEKLGKPIKEIAPDTDIDAEKKTVALTIGLVAANTAAMSIREPLEEAPVVDPDLLFVPLACFDRRGHRIGYGAGYYDLTLARLRAMKPVRAAGVAYGVCEIAAVPYETHDETLDGVVTEQETILFKAQ